MRWSYQLILLSFILVIGVACSGPAVTSSDSTGVGGPALGIAKKDIDAKKSAETLAPGTVIQASLQDSLTTERNEPGDPISLTVVNDVKLNDKVLIPSGSTVKGIVAESKRSGRVKGVAYMALRFIEIILPNGQSYSIQASNVSRLAQTTHKRDALMIGGGAGAGTLIGAIAGGGKGAAIGAAAGGAAGTGAVLATRGKETGFPAGSTIPIKLTQPLKIAT